MFLLFLVAGCSEPGFVMPMPDSGAMPGSDAGSMPTGDGGPGRLDTGADAWTETNAPMGEMPDAGTVTDSGEPCLGVCPDAGVAAGDAGSAPDSGPHDAGTDAGPPADTSRVVQFALGADHTCVLRTSGNVRCWGSGFDSSPTYYYGPVWTNAVSIASNRGRVCAMLTDGTVSCSIGGTPTPVTAPTMDTIAPQCGITTAGAVRCWDLADYVSEPVPAIGDAVAIDQYGRPESGYGTTTCAVRSDWTTVCWGAAPGAVQPGHAPFTSGIDEVALGRTQVCVRAYGLVWCWNASTEPMVVGHGVVDLDVGRAHGCALTSAGRVSCWGQNDRGQLGRVPGGLGPTYPADLVMFEGSPMDAIAIGTGEDHACAALRDGRIACWGRRVGLGAGPDGSTATVVSADRY
jgi:hypothetical protein